MAGIYIKGMEMPKGCITCMFDVYGMCLINKNIEREDELTHACPLIPVPDHGDLIDIGAVNLTDGPYEYADWVEWALQQYQDAPTIIPADREGEA